MCLIHPSNLNPNPPTGALLKRMVTDGDGRRKQNKLPKQLRLPRIDDAWMFFQRDRLKQLHKQEEDKYRELKARVVGVSGSRNSVSIHAHDHTT